jgi:translation initiation factor 1A
MVLFYFQRRKPPEAPLDESRIRLPRKGEILGKVLELKGGSRMLVACLDGKERMARIPGKIRRGVWIKENDVVLVVPWSVEGDEKADIAYRYTRVQVEALQRRGVIPPTL